MLISAGGSSGGRGLVSASGIDSPPSPSPPPAVRHSPRPRLPPPLSAETRASPPLKGRIVRLAEAAASGRQKASCQPHRRHPCRRASAALGGASIEMEARGGGFVSRSWRAAHRSRGGGSQGLILSPVRRVPRPLPLGSARLQVRRSTSSVLSGAAGSRLRHGLLPISAAASCRRVGSSAIVETSRQSAAWLVPLYWGA